MVLILVFCVEDELRQRSKSTDSISELLTREEAKKRIVKEVYNDLVKCELSKLPVQKPGCQSSIRLVMPF